MNDKKKTEQNNEIAAIEAEQATVVDIALAKLVSGAADPKTIEAWKELLNAHYNRPRHSPITDLLRDKGAMEDIKAIAMPAIEKMAKDALWHRIFLFFCFAGIIGAIAFLTYGGKNMDPSAGVILGALAGYLFGRKDG
ncbi:MAG: hypothetical protein ACN2B6_10875 [Rickettsiales bacterium]